MNFSVIIPTYKRAGDLPRLFGSLAEQYLAPDEIVVVIGPNDHESISVARQWRYKLPSMVIIEGKKPSVVNALNTALSAANGDFLCLLDDDVWLPPDWLSKINDAYAADDLLGAYGGRDHLQLMDEPELSNPMPAAVVGKFTWNGNLVGNHHRGSTVSPIEIDVLKGANLSFRREAFKSMEIEPALEGHGAETCWEIDICQTVKLAGYKVIYDNDNLILHYASPRLTTDNRTDVFSPAWQGRVFNESLIITKFRSTQELVFFILKTFFIGFRLQPGLAWAILLCRKHSIKILQLPFKNLKYIAGGIKLGRKKKTDRKLIKNHSNKGYLEKVAELHIVL